ncbi:hypothetical protein H4R19_000755 [Coemansia spiralis]|nr:hypothetical protein H4R19_000755 [Coemansia spiralis]
MRREGTTNLGLLRSCLEQVAQQHPEISSISEVVRQTRATHRIQLTAAAWVFLYMPSEELELNHHRRCLWLADYTPPTGRKLLTDPSAAAANFKRWWTGWVTEADSTSWSPIHRTPLEPKHISLLW